MSQFVSYEDLEEDQQEILEKSDINTLANYCQELRAYEDEIAELEERRLERDTKNRGRTKNSIEKQYFSMVKPMHNKFI